MLAVSNSCHIKPSPAKKVIWEATLSRARYLLMPGYHCTPDGRIQGYQPSIAIRPPYFCLQVHCALFNSCMKPRRQRDQTSKVSPNSSSSPKVLFCGRDIWNCAPPMLGRRGIHWGTRGSNHTNYFSPGLRMNHIFGRNCVHQSIATLSSYIWLWLATLPFSKRTKILKNLMNFLCFLIFGAECWWRRCNVKLSRLPSIEGGTR